MGVLPPQPSTTYVLRLIDRGIDRGNTQTMQRCLLLLLLATSLPSARAVDAAHPFKADLLLLEFPGGPPSIRIAEKSKGDITRAEWTAATAVKLAGCVPDARVTSLTVCINDCQGRGSALTTPSGNFTREMKGMVANLPNGTAFTVKVQVKDGRGKSWPVPDAMFTLVR